MTIPSDFERYELRYIDQGTTFNKTFTAADNAAWDAGTAVKLRCFDVDLSGLTEESVKDPTVKSDFGDRNPPIAVRRAGSFKFKMHLEGGSSDTSTTPAVELLACCLGGLHNPTAAADAVEADSTTKQINATNHGYVNNETVLIGTKGDSGADGKVGVVEDEDPNSDSNSFDVQMAFPAAPAAEAVIKSGHMVYVDETDESYQDFLFIGAHSGSGATDDPDQIQMIGCSGKASIGGLGEGETPFIEFEFMVGQWQWVNYADQASFSNLSSVQGNDPVSPIAEGQLMIQDTATTTRKTIAGGDYTIELGYDLVKIRDDNAPNKIGGWKKVRSDMGPNLTVSAYWANLADMPGLYNDFSNGTAKQVLLQLGNVSQGTVAFYMQNAYLQPVDPANRVELERSTALKLVFEGNKGNATYLSSDEDRLEDAPLVIGFH
jgi:hypothetical protein